MVFYSEFRISSIPRHYVSLVSVSHFRIMVLVSDNFVFPEMLLICYSDAGKTVNSTFSCDLYLPCCIICWRLKRWQASEMSLSVINRTFFKVNKYCAHLLGAKSRLVFFNGHCWEYSDLWFDAFSLWVFPGTLKWKCWPSPELIKWVINIHVQWAN